MAKSKEPWDVPALDEQELLARAFRIKQVRKASDGHLHFISAPHLDRTAPDRGADVGDVHVLEKAKGMKLLAVVTTVHRAVMPSHFTPSVKDVLAQVPAEYLSQVTAYSIESDDSKPNADRPNYHRGVAKFYAGTLPPHIAAQSVILMGRSHRPPAPPPEPQDIPILPPMNIRPRIKRPPSP
ncbi:MAG TPA: hypothetical protein PLX33_12540 [Alphaproteobacteria bacterium]|nr:hypothetical protein [Alphaproteobacteria bacterium]